MRLGNAMANRLDSTGGGGSGDSIYVQDTEPAWADGEKGLWIDTSGGNLNFWVQTGA